MSEQVDPLAALVAGWSPAWSLQAKIAEVTALEPWRPHEDPRVLAVACVSCDRGVGEECRTVSYLRDAGCILRVLAYLDARAVARVPHPETVRPAVAPVRVQDDRALVVSAARTLAAIPWDDGGGPLDDDELETMETALDRAIEILTRSHDVTVRLLRERIAWLEAERDRLLCEVERAKNEGAAALISEIERRDAGEF